VSEQSPESAEGNDSGAVWVSSGSPEWADTVIKIPRIPATGPMPQMPHPSPSAPSSSASSPQTPDPADGDAADDDEADDGAADDSVSDDGQFQAAEPPAPAEATEADSGDVADGGVAAAQDVDTAQEPDAAVQPRDEPDAAEPSAEPVLDEPPSDSEPAEAVALDAPEPESTQAQPDDVEPGESEPEAQLGESEPPAPVDQALDAPASPPEALAVPAEPVPLARRRLRGQPVPEPEGFEAAPNPPMQPGLIQPAARVVPEPMYSAPMPQIFVTPGAPAPVPVPAPRPAVTVASARESSGRRRARLRISRVDPWSVMKTTFLFSIAFGIIGWVAVYAVWTVLASSGLFDSVNQLVAESLSSPSETNPFQIQSYVSTNMVLGIAALIGAVNVVIITAVGTIAAFLYNLAANVIGGLEVTLAED